MWSQSGKNSSIFQLLLGQSFKVGVFNTRKSGELRWKLYFIAQLDSLYQKMPGAAMKNFFDCQLAQTGGSVHVSPNFSPMFHWKRESAWLQSDRFAINPGRGCRLTNLRVCHNPNVFGGSSAAFSIQELSCDTAEFVKHQISYKISNSPPIFYQELSVFLTRFLLKTLCVTSSWRWRSSRSIQAFVAVRVKFGIASMDTGDQRFRAFLPPFFQRGTFFWRILI